MVEAFVLGLEFPKDALSQYPVSFAMYKHDLLAPTEFVLFQCFVEHVHLVVQHILVSIPVVSSSSLSICKSISMILLLVCLGVSL